jgi:hypothetical protein
LGVDVAKGDGSAGVEKDVVEQGRTAIGRFRGAAKESTLRQRPFWVRRAGPSISARDALVSLVDDTDVVVRRKRARDALQLLEVNEMGPALGKDGRR